MRRILFSFIMIGITVGAVATATSAFFSKTIQTSGNTFSIGDVNLSNGWTSGFPFSFANLAPGQEVASGVLGVGYGGSLPADIYFGVKAETGDDLRDILDYYIEGVNAGGDHLGDITSWASVINAFSTWNKIADNVNNGDWKYYKIHIRVHSDAANSYQGKGASNTTFIYAVQHGETSPSAAPWEYVMPTP